jgi:TolB-like protein
MKFLLKTYGEIALLDSAERPIAFPKKALLIIAYLLASDGKSVSRTSMARFLWGEGDLANSLTNLRKLVSRIKSRQSDLGTEFLTFDDTDIFLADAFVASDIMPAGAGMPDNPVDNIVLLAKSLRSKFMERANCQTRAFIDWRESEKRRHLATLKETLDTVVKLPAVSGDIALIKEVALLLFEAEPQDEITHRILLKAFEVDGGLEQLKRIFGRRKDLISSWPAALPASPRSPRSAEATHSAAISSEQDDARRPILRIPRLALLPPGNGEHDSASAVIASSLIEDITLGFCALHSLRVIAPYSAIQIGRQSDVQVALFERYDINYVLETRLSGPHGDLSLFTQLISLPGNEVIWAERFNFGKLDLARNKHEISRQIALATAAEVERHEMTLTYFEHNPAAYHQYLVGQQYLHRLTLPNMRRARKELKAALRQNADFAPALSSIARTYSKEWLLTARGDRELLQSAKDFATRAIAVRNDLPDGYRELGVVKLFDGSIDESVEALEVAEALSPHHADVIADHADTLVHFSRPGLALEKIQRAMELNPINPDSYLWTAAGANYALSQFQTALEYINRMADPSLADRLAAASWAMLGHQEEARMLVGRVRESNPDFDVDRWLSVVPTKERWHKDLYREGLKKAGF